MKIKIYYLVDSHRIWKIDRIRPTKETDATIWRDFSLRMLVGIENYKTIRVIVCNVGQKIPLSN